MFAVLKSAYMSTETCGVLMAGPTLALVGLSSCTRFEISELRAVLDESMTSG